jgi:hypothetical protein
MLSRRQLLGGLLASGVAGCATDSGSTVDLVTKMVTSKGPSAGGYPLSPEQIHDLPYATLGVRREEGERAVMVLVSIDGANLEWVSADGVTMVTSHGWMVQTHGMPRDLVSTRWLSPSAGDPLGDFIKTGVLPARGVYREVDINRSNERSLAVESSFVLRGEETIEILGKKHLTQRIDETAVVQDWRWEARNSFWVDPQTGRVWRSTQQYCPEIAPLTLELLKPAAI